MNNITTLTWSAHDAFVDCLTKKSDADRAKAAVPEIIDRDEAENLYKSRERRITLLELLAQSLLIALRRDTLASGGPLYDEELSARVGSGGRINYSDIPEWERR